MENESPKQKQFHHDGGRLGVPETENPVMVGLEDSENFRSENRNSSNTVSPMSLRKANARRSIRGGKTGGTVRRPLKQQDPIKQAIGRVNKSKLETKQNEFYQVAEIPSLAEKSTKTVASSKKRVVLNASLDKTKEQIQPNPAAPQQATSWKSKIAIALVEGFFLLTAIFMVSPSYEAPKSSTKAFFHTVTQNKPFSFEIEVEGWPAPSYQWRLNGVDVPGATEKRISIDAAQMEHSGTYTCAVENMAGRFLWEEGYVNVIENQAAAFPLAKDRPQPREQGPGGDSNKVINARMCLLQRAPDPVLRSASVDGGAAVIAAGESAGYLECFKALGQQRTKEMGTKSLEKQTRALDLLRSMHGSSTRRSILVNVVSALDDLILAKQNALPLDDLTAALAFEAGLYCASTPYCATNTNGGARSQVVRTIMSSLLGVDESGEML